MSSKLSKGRPTKGGLQTRVWGSLENNFTRNLLLAVALLVGILALIDAAWARGRPQPPPPPPTAGDSPQARFWHGFTGNGATLGTASRLYLLGGSSGSPDYAALNDLWYYRVDNNTWTLAPVGKTTPPGLQHVGWACNGARCVAAGGSNGVSPERDTWIYSYTGSSGAWSKINCRKSPCPTPRQDAALAWDPDHGQFLLFGGLDVSYTSLDDTYTLSGTTWTKRIAGVTPGSRDRAAATHVPGRGVIMFGGQRTGSAFEMVCDMFAWNGSQWVEVTQSGGPCLHSHSMAWESDAPGGGRLIVAGGYTDQADTANNDVWYFTFTGPTAGSWQKRSGQLSCHFDGYSGGIRKGAVMTRDVPSGKKVFFGGGENVAGNGAVTYDDMAVCD